MTYKFSQKSLDRLKDVHPDLVGLVHETMNMQIMDFSVNEGVRTLERQKQLVAEGKSRTMRSKHLIQSDGYGHAVDLYPSPVNMQAVQRGDAREVLRFGVLAGVMLSLARRRGILLVHGADWNGNGQTLDHTFFDAPHFEIVLK